MANSRRRMISFRLDDESYDQLRKICFDNGVNNISDLCRSAVTAILLSPERVAELSTESRLADLEGKVRMLDLNLNQIKKRTPAEETACGL